jgi:tetratricopeptide (TPR) repeat protein
MRKIQLAAAAILAAAMVVGPAAASVLVLGSNPGRACYLAARDRAATVEALSICNLAISGGDLSIQEQAATFVNRGIVKINTRRYDSAIADFDQAIALNPAEPESYLNKASTLLRTEKSLAEAIALYTESLQRETRRPELAYFGRAIAHEASGDIKSAYLDYRRAREAAPGWRLPRRELSRFQVKRPGTAL